MSLALKLCVECKFFDPLNWIKSKHSNTENEIVKDLCEKCKDSIVNGRMDRPGFVHRSDKKFVIGEEK